LQEYKSIVVLFSFSGRGGFFQQAPMSRRKNALHSRFSHAGPDIMGIKRQSSKLIDLYLFLFILGNQHRPSVDFLSHRLFSQAAMKKQADDEDILLRTSSVSSTSVPTMQPSMNQKISAPNDSSANVKV